MTSYDDIRAIASKLPGALEGDEGFGFAVMVKGKWKGFCWLWKERIEPKRPKAPNPRVLAVRVPSLSAKEVILASNEEWFFTEPHYNGFPAVLVRLDAIPPEDLEDLLIEAWRSLAPKEAVRLYDAARSS